jgi:hypothetical protein
MKMKLGLLSCTKRKQNYSCQSRKMYAPSSLFSKAYAYASKNYDKIGILSAKYGLLLPEEVIEPYDLTLKTMRKKQKQAWATQVNAQLETKLDMNSIQRVYIHAGKDYREYLIPYLHQRDIETFIPLKGLSFGNQLKWYNDQI